jgi:hypothetical protein
MTPCVTSLRFHRHQPIRNTRARDNLAVVLRREIFDTRTERSDNDCQLQLQ